MFTPNATISARPIASHTALSFIALLTCMLVSGYPFSLIHPASLVLIFVVACIGLTLPGLRNAIETFYLMALPLICAAGAATSASLESVGEYLALGVVGSFYGLIWFGSDLHQLSQGRRKWVTAVPVIALAAFCFVLSEDLFGAPGLGASWAMRPVLAAALVVGVAFVRFDPFAVCSLGAALTFGIAAYPFQHLDRANALDFAMVFLPYVAALLVGSLHHSREINHEEGVACDSVRVFHGVGLDAGAGPDRNLS